VDRTHAPLLTGRIASLGFALEHQDNFVVGQVGGRQLLLQSAGRTCPVVPPAIRTAANDIRAVNDQNVHQASVRTPREADERVTTRLGSGVRIVTAR
jgi:hypothetical protein